MINSQFIKERIEHTQTYLRHLDQILGTDAFAIVNDFVRMYAAERVFQLIVDEMVDVNNHIIRYSDFTVPDDFQSTFEILAEHDVFPRELAERIAPSVGLRNRLVHRYESVDRKTFLEMIQQDKGDFIEYIAHIQKYLTSADRPPAA